MTGQEAKARLRKLALEERWELLEPIRGIEVVTLEALRVLPSAVRVHVDREIERCRRAARGLP